MSRNITSIVAAGGLLLAAPCVLAADIFGLWETGETHIEIYECGDRICGRIASLDDPLDEDGNERFDKNNPDPALRSRPILGMDIIVGLVRAGKRKWEDGTIYDPRDGKTYKCAVRLERDGSLKVRGYVGTLLLGRTVVWTRIE